MTLPESTVCPCCSGAMHVIGEDVSKRLDVIPAQYQILVTRRPKYACRACEGAVVQAPAPARLIEGGLPTERLVAQVLVDKYADHCPLYRQVQGFARQNIELDRSTLAFWTGYAAAELKPLWRWMRDEVLRSSRLFVDETRAPVLDPGRGRTKTGYFPPGPAGPGPFGIGSAGLLAADGPLPAMIAAGAAATRQRSSTPTHPAVAPIMPSLC